MAAHPDSLDIEGQDLLESALTSSFTTIEVPVTGVPSTTSDAEPTSAEPTPIPAFTPGGAAPDAVDAWKAEYEAQQEHFKAQNAEARDKAERERARWEDVRAREGPPTGPLRGPHYHHDPRADAAPSAPPVVAPSSVAAPVEESPSPADARDLVSGEPEGHAHRHQQEASGLSSPVQVGSDYTPASLSSSFPSSLSIATPPLEHRRHLADEQGHASRAPVPAPAPFGGAAHAAAAAATAQGHSSGGDGPVALTPMVFDSSLAPRARVWALLGSLGINLLLPFVNGVMLGFGEIFAKEFVAVWFGWARPGSTTAGVGLRSSRRK